jgi:hypothetical protein
MDGPIVDRKFSGSGRGAGCTTTLQPSWGAKRRSGRVKSKAPTTVGANFGGGDGRIRTADRGFADPRLNHLATSPSRMTAAAGQRAAAVEWERKTRFELATLSLARRCSTTEPLPHPERSRVPRDACASPGHSRVRPNAFASDGRV